MQVREAAAPSYVPIHVARTATTLLGLLGLRCFTGDFYIHLAGTDDVAPRALRGLRPTGEEPLRRRCLAFVSPLRTDSYILVRRSMKGFWRGEHDGEG